MLKHFMRNAIKMKKEFSEMCLINMRSFSETCQTFPGVLARDIINIIIIDILKAMTAVYSIPFLPFVGKLTCGRPVSFHSMIENKRFRRSAEEPFVHQRGLWNLGKNSSGKG